MKYKNSASTFQVSASFQNSIRITDFAK